MRVVLGLLLLVLFMVVESAVRINKVSGVGKKIDLILNEMEQEAIALVRGEEGENLEEQIKSVTEKQVKKLLESWGSKMGKLTEKIMDALDTGGTSKATENPHDPVAKEKRHCLKMIVRHDSCSHMRVRCLLFCNLLKRKNLDMCYHLLHHPEHYAINGCDQYQNMILDDVPEKDEL
mmetsp:Transcript_27369/g.30485  ORF Transcript_27369/g.30485 Transcript_27369/m.30485 type:complete len:177 (+) Transcript_27369:67-597(+)